MSIQYHCIISERRKAVIEPLLSQWLEQNMDLTDAKIDILKIFDKEDKNSLTFLSKITSASNLTLTRIFKLGLYKELLKEYQFVQTLEQEITNKFICRIKNNYPKYSPFNYSEKDYGILEYDFAIDAVGDVNVLTLNEYIEKIKTFSSSLEKQYSQIIDDIAQGLKTKLYQRQIHYNRNVNDFFSKYIKHFTFDWFEEVLSELPESYRKVLNKNPDDIYHEIINLLNKQIDIHYSSERIHGNLNSKNIVIYEGHNRYHGMLYNFKQNENEAALSYFWDFACLEADLTLSLIDSRLNPGEGLCSNLKEIFESLNKMNLGDSKSQAVQFISKSLINLRESFFRSKDLDLDISFYSSEKMKSYYYNLLIAYIYKLKQSNDIKQSNIIIVFIYLVSLEIPKIDSVWVKGLEKKENKTKQKSFAWLYSLLIIVLTFFIFNSFGIYDKIKESYFVNKLPNYLENKLKEADHLAKESLHRDAFKLYNDLLKSINEKEYPVDYGHIRDQMGICYYYFSLKENREINIKKAIFSHKEAEKIFFEKSNLFKYANALRNLGIAYTKYSEIRDKESNLKKAIKAFETALKTHTVKKFPILYAETLSYLGNAYHDMSTIRNKKLNLKKSIEYLEQCFTILTLKDTPLSYGLARNYIANSYFDLADIENKIDNLNKAIHSYKESLKVRTLEEYYLEYAETQNNLAGSYWKMANSDIPDKEYYLIKASKAYEEAFKVYKKNSYPLFYALSKNNIAQVYQSYSKIKKGTQYLEKALLAHNEALEILTLSKYPLYNALANKSMAYTYYLFYLKTNKKEYLYHAKKNYLDVLSIYNLKKYPVYYADVQKSLAVIFQELSYIEEEQFNISKAIESYEQASIVYNSVEYPVLFAKIQERTGELFLKLFTLNKNDEYKRNAKKYFQNALSIFKEQNEKKEYQRVLKQIKQL